MLTVELVKISVETVHPLCWVSSVPPVVYDTRLAGRICSSDMEEEGQNFEISNFPIGANTMDLVYFRIYSNFPLVLTRWTVYFRIFQFSIGANTMDLA